MTRQRLPKVCLRLFALLALMVVLSPPHSHAALSPAGFEAANRLYEQGKFTDAAAAYQKLLESGQASAALYFNLGNARFKAGQLGSAIAAYRQAGQISPRDPEVRANLQFARNQVQGPTRAAARWQLWLRRLSLNEWTVLAAAGVWLWFLLLIVLQWRPALKPALRNPAIAAGVGAAVLCACLAAALYEARFSNGAIVVTHEATARHGPLEESPTAFTLNDGAELRVLDRKDDWLQVSTDARRIGWLKRDQVILAPAT